jgi:hypothetical protein
MEWRANYQGFNRDETSWSKISHLLDKKRQDFFIGREATSKDTKIVAVDSEIDYQ